MKKNKSEIVVKSNQLIEAQYKLTQREQKIMLYLTSQIHKEDEDFKLYKLPIKKFCDMMGLVGSPKYNEIKDITDGLQKKLLKITKDNKIYSVSWLSLVVYNASEGTISMRFDPFLKPYLLQLKREFTSYDIKNIMSMKHAYSIRVYELLRQYLLIGERKFTLDEFKSYIGLEKHEYERYTDLKRKVILVVEKEINQKTDIQISFTENKERRKVVGLVFSIKRKDAVQEVDHKVQELGERIEEQQAFNFDDKHDFYEALLALGIGKNQINKILNTYQSEQIERNIEFVMMKKAEGAITKSIGGYAFRAISEDYARSEAVSLPAEGKKKTTRTELLPDWLDKRGKEEIRKNGTLEDKRELYWLEFESQKAYEQRLVELEKFSRSLYDDEEKVKQKIIDVMKGTIQKRKELNIEFINVNDFQSDLFRELYERALDCLFETM